MGHTASNVLLHLVFSTKGRRRVLVPEIKPNVSAYLGGIVRELQGVALIINGTADHIHMLIRLPPTRSVAEVMRIAKTNSSRWVHEKWPERRGFNWQTGYAVFSVSESNCAAVTRYIAEQETHHAKVTFQDELIAFLKKNGIRYDERYLWD